MIDMLIKKKLFWFIKFKKINYSFVKYENIKLQYYSFILIYCINNIVNNNFFFQIKMGDSLEELERKISLWNESRVPLFKISDPDEVIIL